MVDPATYKSTCLDGLHGTLFPMAEEIYYRGDLSSREKARIVNARVGQERDRLLAAMPSCTDPEVTQSLHVIVEYCATIVALEYRNMVWSYDYMSLSRRVGELWERVCRAAWSHPSAPDLRSVAAPDFETIAAALRDRMRRIAAPGMEADANRLASQMLDLIGDVNMKGDGVFERRGRPLAIDFKSGFGSNEKGNTERLLRIGRAYRLWNPETRLALLVRQSGRNNRYLDRLAGDGTWEVHCGPAAYEVMREATGADLERLFALVVDFGGDLSSRFWNRLSAAGQDLEHYLEW